MKKRPEFKSDYVKRGTWDCDSHGCKAKSVASVGVGQGYEWEDVQFCLEHYREMLDDLTDVLTILEEEARAK